MAQTLPLFELPETESLPSPRTLGTRRQRRKQPAAGQPALPGMPVVLRPPASSKPPVVSNAPEVFPGANAAKTIGSLFEACRQTGLDTSRLFDCWLTCCHLALDRLPSLMRQVMSSEKPEDSPEQKEDWEKAIADLSPDVVRALSQAFGILLDATADDEGNSTYADVVGQVFEQTVTWRGRRQRGGQYFTPWNIAYCMAQIVLGNGQAEGLLRQRFEQKCQGDPLFMARALTLSALGGRVDDDGWETRQMSALFAEMDPITVIDPCVGSGVMLLAAAKSVPRWMIDAGLVQFYGMDIDRTCAEMARLNARLYGLNGTRLAPADMMLPEQLNQLPWPYDVLYSNAVHDVSPGRGHWEQGVQYARTGRLDEWEGVGCLNEQRGVPVQ